MPNYTALAQTAKRLIGSNGRDVVLVRFGAGSYDPTTNTFSGAADTTDTIKGVRLKYTNSQIDNEVIKRGDIKMFVEAVNLATPPTVDDKIQIDSEIWDIKDVIPLQPADVAVFYELQLRQ